MQEIPQHFLSSLKGNVADSEKEFCYEIASEMKKLVQSIPLTFDAQKRLDYINNPQIIAKIIALYSLLNKKCFKSDYKIVLFIGIEHSVFYLFKKFYSTTRKFWPELKQLHDEYLPELKKHYCTKWLGKTEPELDNNLDINDLFPSYVLEINNSSALNIAELSKPSKQTSLDIDKNGDILICETINYRIKYGSEAHKKFVVELQFPK